MADTDDEVDATVVPLPGDNPEEHDRIRSSHYRYEQLESLGNLCLLYRVIDEAVKGRPAPPELERVVDE